VKLPRCRFGLVCWRFLVIAAFAFWQGGFTFYAAIVVPTATDVLGSALEQGFITRRVTTFLNLWGVIALALFAVENFVTADLKVWRRRLRWLAWVIMVAILVLLFWLHARLENLLDLELGRVLERDSFRYHHRWYLWLSTIQWGCAIVYLLTTLWAWIQPASTQEQAIPHLEANTTGRSATLRSVRTGKGS
jgi:hypothetical protein